MNRRSVDNREKNTSSKTVTSTEESHVEVEPIEPRRKITRQSVAEAINKALPKRNAHVLPEIYIICGRDASWFTRQGLVILTGIILAQCAQHSRV
jgi:hypothetical protein